MKTRVSRRVKRALALGALGALMVMGEAALRPEQAAHADNWQYYLSNLGEYCEGCCATGSLCCRFNDACRREPLRPSTSG